MESPGGPGSSMEKGDNCELARSRPHGRGPCRRRGRCVVQKVGVKGGGFGGAGGERARGGIGGARRRGHGIEIRAKSSSRFL